MLNNYICAVDIGSSKIAAALIELKRKGISNIFFDSVPSRGIKRGIIVDSADLVTSVSKTLKNLKVKSGINIKFVYINISGQDIVTKHSLGIIALAERGNKVITSLDIQKVNEQARILGSNLEEEIIHQIPFGYSIDSRSNILNPLGLYSHRLEVDLYLICSKLSTLESLTRVIDQAGYELKKIFFSGLATSRVILNQGPHDGINPVRNTGFTNMENKISNGVNIICDIGADITELLTFKDSRLRDIEILPVGGNDLTSELSDMLNIAFDLAEDLKLSYAMIGDQTQIKEDKEILIKKGQNYKPIKQKLVSQILTSKTKLICQAIKDALDKKLDSKLLNNFIVTGRTIMLEGFLETLEYTLGSSVKIGRITDTDIISLLNKDNLLSGQKYLNYITCLGIICEILKGKHPEVMPISQTTLNPILKLINRFKEVYEEYF